MLTREDYLMISERSDQGVYLKDIAAELGVHPRTVRRALQRGFGLGAPLRGVGGRKSPGEGVESLGHGAFLNRVRARGKAGR